ncbi:hypothetical protein [Streptomyces sp. NPDC096032]
MGRFTTHSVGVIQQLVGQSVPVRLLLDGGTGGSGRSQLAALPGQ